MSIRSEAPRSAPSLVGISHGTSSPVGQGVVSALMSAVDDEQRELRVTLGHVDVQQPDVETCLELSPRTAPVVIVPLLLSAGYHVHVDLAEAVTASERGDVAIADALGPDDRLISILRRRLAEAGATRDDVIVLAAAGSSDAGAVADCRTVANLLAASLGQPVAIGFLSAAEPRLEQAVTTARERTGRRVVVASYLLAPGYFQGLAEAAGADVVTSPLLSPAEPAPRELVELVIARYKRAAQTLVADSILA